MIILNLPMPKRPGRTGAVVESHAGRTADTLRALIVAALGVALLVWLVASPVAAAQAELTAPASPVAAAQAETTAPAVDLEDPAELVALGQALIQETRETADYSLLVRAEEAFQRLLGLEPDNAEGTIGLGTIALAQHDFSAALELGREALAAAPGSPRAMGVMVDALVELGRYDEARTSLELMLATRPDLASYTRLSYYQELHGDNDLAIDAMERAVLAGGPAVENAEFARVLLGDLWLREGDTPRARFLYQTALENLPDYVPAMRGLAWAEMAEGDLAGAIEWLERAVAHIPLSDLVISLGEAYAALGDRDSAEANYRLVRDIEGLLRSGGVVADPTTAIFEADHGDPREALELAQATYDKAPSVRSADALAWALHANGRMAEARAYADEARVTGWRDPIVLAHAGIIALAAGDKDEATALLTESLARNVDIAPLLAEQVRRSLHEIEPAS